MSCDQYGAVPIQRYGGPSYLNNFYFTCQLKYSETMKTGLPATGPSDEAACYSDMCETADLA